MSSIQITKDAFYALVPMDTPIYREYFNPLAVTLEYHIHGMKVFAVVQKQCQPKYYLLDNDQMHS